MNNIRIKQYEQTADEKVSFNGIKWLRKWDVCVQCDSAEAAEALRARLSQPEPAECDGGQCGIGGYCKQCPKTQPEQEPVAWADKVDIDRDGHDLWVSRQKPAKDGVPLYTAPPKREWVGLTDDDMNKLRHLVDWTVPLDIKKFARAIEAKLKEKNT